jgi:hypothetical protein
MKGGETGVGRAPTTGKPTLADNGKATGGAAEILVTAVKVDKFWNAGVLVFVGLGKVSRGRATVEYIGVSLGFDLIPTGNGWELFMGRVGDRPC